MHIVLYGAVHKLRITELLILIARKWKEMGMIQNTHVWDWKFKQTKDSNPIGHKNNHDSLHFNFPSFLYHWGALLLYLNNELKLLTYQECTNESQNNASNVYSRCINSGRVKHHAYLSPRSNEEGCAAIHKTNSECKRPQEGQQFSWSELQVISGILSVWNQ